MDIRKFLKKINENDTILLRTKKKKILPSGGHILSTEECIVEASIISLTFDRKPDTGFTCFGKATADIPVIDSDRKSFSLLIFTEQDIVEQN